MRDLIEAILGGILLFLGVWFFFAIIGTDFPTFEKKKHEIKYVEYPIYDTLTIDLDIYSMHYDSFYISISRDSFCNIIIQRNFNNK